MKTSFLILFALFISVNTSTAGITVEVTQISGDVKIRRGVEETWQKATTGMILEEIDTILTGESGSVILKTPSGDKFTLGSFAILDISDLRNISEKELFLFLMSNKIKNIEPGDQKSRLRIGNVSVVHGESKAGMEETPTHPKTTDRTKEINGAKALYNQNYFPNTIVKLNKIMKKFSSPEDCGEMHFYLGKSFEAINQNGQAIDSYQIVIDQHCDNPLSNGWANEAQQAIKRLQSGK